MRFMMMMIPGVYQGAGGAAVGAGFAPKAEDVAAMTKFNSEMIKAGVMLSGEGLHPPSTGSRVSFAGGKPSVTDGPFTESKEVLGGFWILNVKSKQEAVDWARRCPALSDDVIEIRQIFEMSDFPDDVQDAAKNS